MNKNEKMVPRFGWAPRVAHWTYVVCFLMLYITGMPMLYNWDKLNFIYSLFGGPENTHLVHRIFAVILTSTIVFMLIVDRKSFFYWLKQCVTWGKRDWEFIKVFPKEFFGLHAKFPKQGFLNGGTKINSILQILCCAGFVISGFIIWFPQFFPTNVVQWGYPVHTVTISVATAVVIGHIFLAALHPNAKGGLHGMIKGDVSEEYAKVHHGAWYDEMVATGQYVPKDQREKEQQSDAK